MHWFPISRGNLVLVGPIGAHLAVLVRLALHVADVPIHPVDTSKHSNFLDGLRSAVRLTGAEGKVLSLLFTAVSYSFCMLSIVLQISFFFLKHIYLKLI